MADQTDFQQGFPREGQEFDPQVIDQFYALLQSQPPLIGDYGTGDGGMQGLGAGGYGGPGMPIDPQLLTNGQQIQAPQPAHFAKPPNTDGPHFGPRAQWHYQSTLENGERPPDYKDANFEGAYYAPGVGWYFKILNPALTAEVPPVPPLGVQQAYTPMSATPYSSHVPSGVATPVAPVSQAPFTPTAVPAHLKTPKAKPGRKPKYGPGVYTSLQKNGSVSGPPRAASVSEAQYTSAAHRRNHQSSDAGTAPTFGRKRKNPSIVQACVCSDKVSKKIPRPRNAFILFRSAMKETIMKQQGTKDNQNVSKKAGEQWTVLPLHLKQQYHALAAEEKLRHQRDYPDYKYEPGLAARAKFGSASCTCGAYRINVEHALSKRKSGAAMDEPMEAQEVFDEFDEDEGEGDDDDDDDDDAYMPPKSQRRIAPAPLPYPAPAGYAPASVFPTQAPVAPMSRKRGAEDQLPAHKVDPLRKRLRSATQQPHFSYAEQEDMDMNTPHFSGFDSQLPSTGIPDYDFDVDFYKLSQASRQKRPSQIQSPPAELAGGQQSYGATGVDFNTSPARNTRSQSKARVSPPSSATGLGQTGMGNDMVEYPEVNFSDFLVQSDPLMDPNIDALFGERAFGDGDGDGENIVVASRRPSGENANHSYSLRPRGGSKSPEQGQT